MKHRLFARIHQEQAARSLVIVEGIVPIPTPSEVLVKVALAIVDPEPLLASHAADIPAAAFVGTVHAGPQHSGLHQGDLVFGISPLSDFATLAPESLQQLPVNLGLESKNILILRVLSSILTAVAEIRMELGDHVLVSGGGLTAKLMEPLVEFLTARAPRTHAGRYQSGPAAASGELLEIGRFDVLIDTTADPTWWPSVLPLVREQGWVLLLLPPGHQVHPFDFYPTIQQRSLRVCVRRVPAVDSQDVSATNHESVLKHLLNRWLFTLNGSLSPVNMLPGTVVHLDTVRRGEGLVFRFEDSDAVVGSEIDQARRAVGAEP